MTRRLAIVTAVLVLAATSASRGAAVSAVFDGDPVDGTTGLPYEILPGQPLVRPGPDGVPGTMDDVIDGTKIGDIDLVARAGAVAAAPVIPPPAAAAGRAALPVGVAGPPSAGGTAIPFTVFLSNGATGVGEPSGRLLAAADMDGIPVIVAAFADLDGDGAIGPTMLDDAGDADLHLELRELEPVGRAAALFAGGVARGSIAIRRGLPASRGGLTVALVALALTGPLDPGFFEGLIPSGPAITTALPFLPLRDLNRLIRDRPAAAGPNTTLQQLVQPAAVPRPDTYALPLDGSSPTIDAAVVYSQPAVRVSFREAGSTADSAPPLDRLVLGTRRPADRASLRLVPVDRFENLADPPPNFAVTVRADAALRILGQRRQVRPLRVRSADGRRVLGLLATGTADGASGTLRIERDGIAVAALPFTVDGRANRHTADVVAPSAAAATIQAAVDTATDRNGDGVVTVRLRRGVFREDVTIARPLELRGAGSAQTFIVGGGAASVVTASAPGVTVRDLTVAGGSSGVRVTGRDALVASSAAWRNVGPGVVLSADNAELWASTVADNGDLGVAIAGAPGARCADTVLRGNEGPGISVQSTGAVQLVDNQLVENDGAGLLLSGANSVGVRGNQSVLNIGAGIELLESPNASVTQNVCAVNDDDGLRMDRADDAAITGNVFESNKGTGLFVRRTQGADFSAAPGIQDPPGDNAATGNRKGDVEVRGN